MEAKMCSPSQQALIISNRDSEQFIIHDQMALLGMGTTVVSTIKEARL